MKAIDGESCKLRVKAIDGESCKLRVKGIAKVSSDAGVVATVMGCSECLTNRIRRALLAFSGDG
jgi:hypothetical protein